MLMDNLPGSVQQLAQSQTSTDEVANFLLYVRSLGYQERPDYLRLKDLLATGAPARIDLSRPHKGQIQGSPTTSDEVPEPPARGKMTGRERWSSKPKAVAMEMDGGDVRHSTRLITRPPSKQKADKATTPGRRSARSKVIPLQNEHYFNSEYVEESEVRTNTTDVSAEMIGPGPQAKSMFSQLCLVISIVFLLGKVLGFLILNT